jgi:hypothetical protein
LQDTLSKISHRQDHVVSVNGLSFFLSLSPSIKYSEKGHKEKAAGFEPTALSTSGVSQVYLRNFFRPQEANQTSPLPANIIVLFSGIGGEWLS